MTCREFESWSSFLPGEILEYMSDQHVPYDEATDYYFKNPDTGEVKKWSLRDEDPLDMCADFFRPV